MTSRTISPDGLALRYALACSIRPLRSAALAHVQRVIRQHHGHAGAIAEALGVDRRTYERLRADYPELQKAHENAKLEKSTQAGR